MILLLLFDISFIFMVNLAFGHQKDIKTILYLFIAGFTIYSGIGIFMLDIPNSGLYFFQFVLFSASFFIVAYIKQGKTSNVLRGTDFVFENYPSLVFFFTVLYIATFFYPFIIGGFTVNDLLDLGKIFINYRATSFSLRLERRSNLLYMIITNQLRTICAPFFYLTLYKYRRNVAKFIGLYLLPILLKTVADSYLSRNNMAVYATFLFIYLVYEGFIGKKTAIIIMACAIPFVGTIFNMLAAVRQGGSFSISFTNMGESLYSLLQSECSYPQFYDTCSTMTNPVLTVSFFVYLALVVIPSQAYALIGLQAPNLPYLMTEVVLGMSFGDSGYYILLPSVLGEAIILFGRYFAWIYGIFYALLIVWFLHILSREESLKYLKLFFMLDFFRQFRGGSQYVLSSWLTTIIPFAVIVYFLSKRKIRIKIR